MSDAGHVRAARPDDVPGWGVLRAALWPDEMTRHASDMADILHHPERAIGLLAFDDAGNGIGFAEAALRADYVNGTDSSPVGFLEGLYVAPGHRRRGVGRALVNAAERWTRAQGCSELASDALLDNLASHAAHIAYGFVETERVVYFRKPLD